MRVSFDTNILVYAADPTAGARTDRARALLRAAAPEDSLLTQQVIGEFLNVSRRMSHLDQRRLRRIAVGFSATFPVVPTPRELLFAAFDRAGRYQLQFWDAVIATVCLSNNVEILISEDYQDRFSIEGLTILNPFVETFDWSETGLKPPPGTG